VEGRPDLFGAYLSVNPALHRNLDYFLELEPAARTKPAPILITRASEDKEQFRSAMDRWLAHWWASESDALDLSVETLDGQHHASSAPAAYRAAVQWWSPGRDEACSQE